MIKITQEVSKLPAKFTGVAEYANGTKQWFLDGNPHREDGPAYEGSSGTKQWYLNGKLHRLDGPAIEYADGDKSWYLDGSFLTEIEFNARLNPYQYQGKVFEIEGKKYTLTPA
jgi:hypothetical protein